MEPSYHIEFYNETVRQEIANFPVGIRARTYVLFDRMETQGGNLGFPHTALLTSGLFELRVKSREGIGRTCFCMVQGRRIVILHAFVKKTQKTPRKDLQIALKRMKEVV